MFSLCQQQRWKKKYYDTYCRYSYKFGNHRPFECWFVYHFRQFWIHRFKPCNYVSMLQCEVKLFYGVILITS
jgi:hypothetical protein